MVEEFFCDMCEGDAECDEDCLCDSCREAKGDAYFTALNDTYG